MCYVSFSGGKDSSVLADLTARVCKALNCKLVLWFSDTGLEFPEVKIHVKEFPTYLRNRYGIEVELVVDYPRDKSGKRISFREMVLTEGYPVILKLSAARFTMSRNLVKIAGLTDVSMAEKQASIICKNGSILSMRHLRFPISAAKS